MTTPYSETESESAIRTLAETAQRDGVFPGIEILVARENRVLFHQAYGRIDCLENSPILTTGSLFDLASLTKPLATAAAVVHLSDRGKIDLSAPISYILPEFLKTDKTDLTPHQLLTHSAGFSDWIALYDPRFDQQSAWEKLVRHPLSCKPGSAVIYSCLGYIVLAEMIRRISKVSLSEYCKAHLYQPLGLKNLMFNPDPERADMVPTAYCPLRKKQLRGIVHDENAFALGGEGGNAGLFGSAEDLHTVCLMLLSSGKLNGKRIFSNSAVDGILNNQNLPSLPARTYGWDVNDGSETDMSCSSRMPIGSIGHLGFTGTSIWMDPVSRINIILLSNRVNLSREDNIPLMRLFRPRMHALLLSTVL